MCGAPSGASAESEGKGPGLRGLASWLLSHTTARTLRTPCAQFGGCFVSHSRVGFPLLISPPGASFMITPDHRFFGPYAPSLGGGLCPLIPPSLSPPSTVTLSISPAGLPHLASTLHLRSQRLVLATTPFISPSVTEGFYPPYDRCAYGPPVVLRKWWVPHQLNPRIPSWSASQQG